MEKIKHDCKAMEDFLYLWSVEFERRLSVAMEIFSNVPPLPADVPERTVYLHEKIRLNYCVLVYMVRNDILATLLAMVTENNSINEHRHKDSFDRLLSSLLKAEEAIKGNELLLPPKSKEDYDRILGYYKLLKDYGDKYGYDLPDKLFIPCEEK